MAGIKYVVGVTIIFLISICRVKATCVLNSDFGFTLDCAFKKSGLFRVRNLGGVKAHVGLGFSIGDELGFPQSLSNLDTSKRRSVSAANGAPLAGNSIGARNGAQQQRKGNVQPMKNRLTVRIPSTSAAPPTTKFTPPIVAPVEENALQTGRSQSMRQMSLTKPNQLTIPPFKPIAPAQDMVAPLPTVPTKQVYAQYPIPSQNTIKPAPGTHSQNTQTNLNRMGQLPKSNFVNVSAAPMRVLNIGQSVRHSEMSNLADQAFKTVPAPVIVGSGPQYPSFQAMPASISRSPIGASIRVDDSSRPVASVSVVSPQAYKNTVQVPLAPTMMTRFPSAASFSQNTLALRKEHVPASAYPAQYQPTNYAQLQNHYSYNQQQIQVPKVMPKIDNMVSYNTIANQNSAPDYSSQAVYEKILAISKATNLSVEAIEAAVKLRQQQLISQMINSPPSTTTTTTTTTPRPPPPPPPPPKRYTKYQDPAQKVMNAPKEYYPVGYDKNFDDNFTSKVELPDTSFYCGDQKHFPGLYGDEDLGCMVFHVCALTDEGLIMKSFLCPESTLFDQTILKCNWWFYVDCKSSKRLYDSNIPISKSYQLMKALTFFSSYKKEVQGEDANNNVARSAITENKEGVRNAVKILQTQSHMELPRVEIVESKSSPTTAPSTSRSSKGFTPVNAIEINSLSTDVREEDNITGEKVEQVDNNRKYRQHATSRPKEDKQKASVSTNTEQNIQKIASPQTTSSTEKNTTKSTIVRKPLRKRPNINRTKPKEIVSNSTTSTESSDTAKQRHRSERASEERKDDDVYKKAKTSQEKINIQEVAGNANSHVIKPSRKESVDVTIAKMDEAIIGQKKQGFT